jgi:hypothetical protein
MAEMEQLPRLTFLGHSTVLIELSGLVRGPLGLKVAGSAKDECRYTIKDILEGCRQPVPQARVLDELCSREPLRDGAPEQGGLRERVRRPGEQDHGAGQPRPVRRPRIPVVRATRGVQRVGQQDQGEGRPGRVACVRCGEAGDAPAERVAPDGQAPPGGPGRGTRRAGRGARQDLAEPGDGAFGPALWQVDRARLDAAGPQALDVRGHAGGGPRRPVAEHEDVTRHTASSSAPRNWLL